jgi:hypothetical protein
MVRCLQQGLTCRQPKRVHVMPGIAIWSLHQRKGTFLPLAYAAAKRGTNAQRAQAAGIARQHEAVQLRAKPYISAVLPKGCAQRHREHVMPDGPLLAGLHVRQLQPVQAGSQPNCVGASVSCLVHLSGHLISTPAPCRPRSHRITKRDRCTTLWSGGSCPPACSGTRRADGQLSARFGVCKLQQGQTCRQPKLMPDIAAWSLHRHKGTFWPPAYAASKSGTHAQRTQAVAIARQHEAVQ